MTDKDDLTAGRPYGPYAGPGSLGSAAGPAAGPAAGNTAEQPSYTGAERQPAPGFSVPPGGPSGPAGPDESFYDFDDDDQVRGGTGRRTLLMGVAGVAVVAIFVGIVWYAYTAGVRSGQDGAPPVITAQIGPTKVKPAEPGGMVVPNQDISAYGVMKPGTQAEQQDVNLRPRTEEPVDLFAAGDDASATPMGEEEGEPDTPANVAAGQAATSAAALPAPPAGTTQNIIAPPVPAQMAAAQPVAPAPVPQPVPPAAVSQPAPAAPAPGTPVALTPPPTASVPATQAPQVTSTPVAAPKAVTPPKVAAPAAKAAPAAPTGSGWGIQLASVPSSKVAEQEWSRISGKYAADLNGITHTVVKADIPGKGTYYRVQAGNMGKESADKLCTSLKGQGQGCLVVKR
ncbi:SPOR domain-containing protein [Radicibacter daui]|uniref:SPOR domain-containing protein n=1 Tax=Radicibacter daui TaxID=3064829 RepID=UPI004046ADBC